MIDLLLGLKVTDVEDRSVFDEVTEKSSGVMSVFD